MPPGLPGESECRLLSSPTKVSTFRDMHATWPLDPRTEWRHSETPLGGLSRILNVTSLPQRFPNAEYCQLNAEPAVVRTGARQSRDHSCIADIGSWLVIKRNPEQQLTLYLQCFANSQVSPI